MNTNFSTTDFNSACIIRTCGIPLLHLIKNDNRIITFVFNSSPSDCEQIVKKHWDRELQLETRLLFEVINELKTRVYQELRKKP